jgi:hypothetical protein
VAALTVDAYLSVLILGLLIVSVIISFAVPWPGDTPTFTSVTSIYKYARLESSILLGKKRQIYNTDGCQYLLIFSRTDEIFTPFFSSTWAASHITTMIPVIRRSTPKL